MLLDAVPMGRLPSIVSDSASWSARSHPIRPAIERSRSAALWGTGAGRLSQVCLEVRLGTWSGHCATACDATHAAAFATGRLSVLSVLSLTHGHLDNTRFTDASGARLAGHRTVTVICRCQ